jgi:hypothetical protein
MNLHPFIYVATALFAFLSLIWNSKDWVNVFLKFSFGILAFWGILIIFKS